MSASVTRPTVDSNSADGVSVDGDLTGTRFSFNEARRLIDGLGRPKAWIYWTDFLASIITGHVAFFFIPRSLPDSVVGWGIAVTAYVVTVLAYMRSLMFIHELTHLPKEGFRAFRVVWNLLCGVFLFVPSFLYYPHVDHHRRKHYGTEHDGEYLSLSHHGRWLIVGFLLQSLVIPILGYLRFAVISPICWLVPGARRWVHKHASTLLVDPFYERTDHGEKLMRLVVTQEVLVFAWAMVFATRYYFRTGEGFNPFWVVAYLVSLGLLTLNAVRTLGAHRWTNHKENQMTFEQQMLDSVNYPHVPWLSELWGPVGTRYHALHHLFPSMPYHDLGKAHRQLVAGLPADSPYHQTISPGLWHEIKGLWNRAKESEQQAPHCNTFTKPPITKSTTGF